MPSALPELRNILIAEINKEGRSQGEGDTELMKLLCIQIFIIGEISDTLLIWQAKQASMDAGASIDATLLCIKGLSETKLFLQEKESGEAKAALKYIEKCESAGDFESFNKKKIIEQYEDYYCE